MTLIQPPCNPFVPYVPFARVRRTPTSSTSTNVTANMAMLGLRRPRPPPIPRSRRFSSRGDGGHGRDGPLEAAERALGVAGRVVRALPGFLRCLERGRFAPGREPSAMFVLTQFPRAVGVDIEEFLQGAERVAHTVFERLYASDAAATGPLSGIDGRAPHDRSDYLTAVAAAACVPVLKRKPVALKQRLGAGTHGSRLVLEQLTINRVSLATVDYYVARGSASGQSDAQDGQEKEWLALEVAYDVMEHVQVLAAGGIDDQRTMRTRFQWTFESEVTQPEMLEWAISRVSAFSEEPAIVRA